MYVFLALMAQSGKSPLRRIYDLLVFEKEQIWAIYFYAILDGMVALSLPLGIQSIISFVIGGSVSVSLVLLIALVVAGVFIVGLLQVNQRKLIEKIQQQLFVRYSFLYANTIPKLDLRATHNYYLPELVNRFLDTISIQKSVGKLLLEIPTAIIQILFGLLLLSFYHPVFIFLGALLITVLILLLRFTGRYGMQTSIEESDYKYRVLGHLEEMARAVFSFKFFRYTGLNLRMVDADVKGYLEARTAHFKILLTQYWALISFKVLITASMLIIGAGLLIQGELNIGQFIATEIVILAIINSVEKLIINMEMVYDVVTSAEKVNNMLEKPVDAVGVLLPPVSGIGMVVSVKDLSFSYAGEDAILEDISFDVPAGSKVAIVGSTGSGKSTLLRVLSGSYQPTHGGLLLNNIPFRQYNPDALRKQMGVFFNSNDIFEGTLLQNLTMSNNPIPNEEVLRLINVVQLSDFVNTLPEGLFTPLSAAGFHLSPRTIHKILLVRALVDEPALILLEQPGQTLTAGERDQVERYLVEQMPHTTCFVIDAGETFTKSASRILHLESGRLV